MSPRQHRSASLAAEVTSEMVDANSSMIAENRAMFGNTHSAGTHLAYSPVSAAKAAKAIDIPMLKFESPPPAFPLEVHDASGSNFEGNSALSNKLLHEAFASLSLTDKCALSLSMGQLNPESTGSTKGSATNTPRTTKLNLGISLSPLDTTSLNSSTAGTGNADEISEMQSVLSETDKESLDVAMSMMGHLELRQVEDEVRTIQNNVRGWILRKNYTNLREAARVLQLAWREKKHKSMPSQEINISALQGSSSNLLAQLGRKISATQQGAEPSPTSSTGSSGGRNSSDFTGAVAGLHDPNPAQLMAAATLQAATRGMLARRSFSSVRKQTMASLVIQKSLVKWWESSKCGAGAAPASVPTTPLTSGMRRKL
jgi:hypothetical protein